MRILQVNKFNYLRGGAERYFLEIQKILADRGHEVLAFSMHHERNEPSPYETYFVSHVDFNRPMSWDEKLKVIPRVLYFREAERKMKKLIEEMRPDIAHLHNIAHQLSPSILTPLKKNGIPVVQTLHDYKLICPTYLMLAGGRICERCKGHRYYQAVLQRCNKGSLTASFLNCLEMYLHTILKLYEGIDLFISPSLFLMEKFVEHGISRERMVHLPNFIRIEPGDGDSPPASSDAILYFGRISREKGLVTLIRAMGHLPDLQLKIAGEGPQRIHLENYIGQEKIKNVTFLGFLGRDALAEAIRTSLCVVVPSEYYENNPFTILEAFARGRPVIGSRIGGIPEMVRDGQTGLTFEPGDVDDLTRSIRELAGDPGLRSRMAGRCRHLVETAYNADVHAEKLVDIYRGVIDEHAEKERRTR